MVQSYIKKNMCPQKNITDTLIFYFMAFLAELIISVLTSSLAE